MLDLFAGTGQLGIEALSRGAASATFVDMRRDAANLVGENLKLTGLQDRGTGDLRGRHGIPGHLPEKFDIVFLDPPYDAGLLEQAIAKITQFDILRQHGIMICESKVSWALPPWRGPMCSTGPTAMGRSN